MNLKSLWKGVFFIIARRVRKSLRSDSLSRCVHKGGSCNENQSYGSPCSGKIPFSTVYPNNAFLCNFKLPKFQNFDFNFRFGFKTEEQNGEKVKGLRNNRNRENPVKMTSQRTNCSRRAMSQRWRMNWK